MKILGVGLGGGREEKNEAKVLEQPGGMDPGEQERGGLSRKYGDENNSRKEG